MPFGEREKQWKKMTYGGKTGYSQQKCFRLGYGNDGKKLQAYGTNVCYWKQQKPKLILGITLIILKKRGSECQNVCIKKINKVCKVY